MMNIEFQCGGLILLSVLLVIFLKEKKLQVVNSKLFFVAILSCIICVLFDIASIIFIHEAVYNGFSDTITKIICKVYLGTLILQGYQGFIYASSEILYAKRYKRLKVFYLIFFAVSEFAIMLSDISYYMHGRTVYSFGPAAMITYGSALVLVASTIFIAFKYKSGMMRRRRNAMLIWQGFWLLAAVVQFIFPELLLVGFASAIGMVILYAELENPNEFMDRETGLFTQNAMNVFVKDKYRAHKKFSAIYFKVKFVSDTVEYETESSVTRRIVRALGKLGKEPAFKLDDNLYAIIYDTEVEMMKKFAVIKDLKAKATDIKAEGVYMLVPDSMIFNSSDEFFKFQRFYGNSESGTIIADEETIGKIRKIESTRIFIDKALQDDRIKIYYQPFYDTRKHRYTVAEALLRIFDEDGNVIPPMDIIPVAEENGQIVPLGIRIFEKVCEFLSKGEVQTLGIEYIEINISAAQFDTDNPYTFVLDVMDRYNIKPEWINLEITETASNRKHILLSNMNKLIEKGIHFSLDDFGTGRSNLDYFVTMPIRNIKFDYSFTQSYFTNDRVKHVMAGMADITHRMHMNIVSEGVETKEQMLAMKDLGVEYIQGYYFSKPVCEEDFMKFLREKNQLYIEKGVREDV